MLDSIEDYAQFIYALPARYPIIQKNTLRLYTVGPYEGVLKGEVHFERGIVLRVVEMIDFAQGMIRRYSYTLIQDGEKCYWYDPQPHPENESLAISFPHHQHVPPDIKHHRVPAPHLSFTVPNLPALIEEIKQRFFS